LRRVRKADNIVKVGAWDAQASANLAYAEWQSRFVDMNAHTNIVYSETQS